MVVPECLERFESDDSHELPQCTERHYLPEIYIIRKKQNAPRCLRPAITQGFQSPISQSIHLWSVRSARKSRTTGHSEHTTSVADASGRWKCLTSLTHRQLTSESTRLAKSGNSFSIELCKRGETAIRQVDVRKSAGLTYVRRLQETILRLRLMPQRGLIAEEIRALTSYSPFSTPTQKIACVQYCRSF